MDGSEPKVSPTQPVVKSAIPPAAMIHVDHFYPLSTFLGGVLSVVLLAYMAVIFFRRTPKRCLRFLCLAVATLLFMVAGMLWDIEDGIWQIATDPTATISDWAACVYRGISDHWWMLAASVVTIPLGIYWTVRAYMDEVLSRCAFSEDEESPQAGADEPDAK